MSSAMAATGSKIQTAHDDTREFIRGLEMTARKVLTNANKRRLEELHRQQCMARRMGAGAEVDDPPVKFVVEVPPGVKDWGDQLASKTMEIACTGLTVGVRPTRPAKHHSLDVIDAAGAQGSGLPSLGGGGTNAAGGAASARGVFDARKLPRISRSAGSLTFSGRTPSRATTAENGRVRGTLDDGGGGGGGGGTRGTKVARGAIPVAKIDGRLTSNPLFTASMMELTKPSRSAAAGRNKDSLNGDGDDEEEAPGGIANMRVVNASKIIGGNGANNRPVSRKPKRQRAETEAQGVTSWSSDDLRVKYRAERDREEAYQAFRLEEQVADALERDYGQVVAVPEVDRHPLYVAYYAQLERENTRCLLRASARNKMKRFITDVHTVWLTNLAHHPEFRRTVKGVFAGGEKHCNGDGSDNVNQEESTPGRRGLDGGRDSTAIAASQSQIQSVQPKRAFREAFYYPSKSAEPSPRTEANGDRDELGGQPGRGSLQESAENAQDGRNRMENEGGESPELPAPAVIAPTLAVLACERHRTGPVSTAGSSRRSIGGGGGVRRSIGGGVGGGGREDNSSLAARTVLLRVLRFAPSPPPPPPPLVLASASDVVSTDTASRTSGVLQVADSDIIGCSAAEVASNNVGNSNTPPSDSSQVVAVVAATSANTRRGGNEEETTVAISVASSVPSNVVEETQTTLPQSQPQPTPEATWLISSFCPYDGSETGILVDHEVVAKRVGEALSALTPLTTATGFTASRNEAREPAGDNWGAGGRLRLLRKGVRVPALAVDGHVVGKVLSVVEVFLSTSPPPPGEASDKKPSGGIVGVGENSSGGGDARVAAIVADNAALEVTAYPALAVLCPSQGPRRTERQRVILTAESLWQRRRSLHPELMLFDKPPTDLAGWLRGRSLSAETTRAGAEDGGEDGEAARADGREGQRGGDILGDFGTEVGEGGGREWGRGGVHEALGDLVGMVAFGPPGVADGDGRGSRSMPLLLQPAQSVGLVAQKATVGAAAADMATSLVNKHPLPGGVATLTDESRAEVLLSLVRLGASGRGRNPAIIIDGIASSSIVDSSGQDRAQAWEKEADRVEPLSMRVSGRRAYTREVPGTCCVGRMGVTFTYPQGVERTRAVASFFRDASLSSSDSVMVTVALALDTPRLSPSVTAWERESAEPETAPDENVLGIVPGVMISAGTVLRERVVSELGGTLAPDALILTDAERSLDYCFCQPEPAAGGRGDGRVTAAMAAGSAQKGQPQKGVRHRRFMKEMDEQGFRRYAIYRLLKPDGHLQTLGFGVTKRAALPNTSAVCGRSTFHSEQRCTEQLCRQRTAKDYAYVSANLYHRGPSDPGSYSVSCTHERMRALLRTGLERYNAEMARVAAERERQAKDAALQAKVDIGKAQLATRRAREDAAARSLARKDDARNLKISAGADRNRHKWELRVEDSRVVETRGSWEKRKDSGGSVFYCHAGDKTVPEPFSWDPPDCWDVPDPVAASMETGGLSVGGGSEPIADSVAARGDSTELSSLREVGATVEPDNNGDGGGGDGGGGGGSDQSSPILPRQYTEEEKISLAVTQLAQNEKLLGALAWRLGIPLANVRPNGREPPLARARGAGGGCNGGEGGVADAGGSEDDDEELEENKGQVELGELDELSDSDGERGDASGPPGPLPQDHSDLRRIRVAQRRRTIKAEKGHGHKQPHQRGVPPLPLAEASRGGEEGVFSSLPPRGLAAAESLEAQIGGLGWRRLARTNLVEKFLDKVKNPRMQGPRPEAVNTRPEPRPMFTVDPVKATKQLENFTVPVGSMFVADVVEEHARVLQEAERRMKREEMLAEDDSSAAFDADKFAADGPQQFTTTERRLMVLAEDGGGGGGGRNKGEVQGEEANSKAVVAAKTGNLAELEVLLYDDVPPDTKDSNGNSLLLLASQQGNKRMVKFLLRKGATMNHQNMDGNSVLHFCYSTGREDLAEYLKLKGADDSLLNGEGLTCYEGLHAEGLDGI